jgi:hypothetical protein
MGFEKILLVSLVASRDGNLLLAPAEQDGVV